MPKIVERGEVYLGIDPGASGGLAWVGDISCGGVPMPSTLRDVWDLVRLCPGDISTLFAMIERNTGYVGGQGNPGSAMFKFGVGTGALLMALTAAGIPFEEVTPGQWQRALKIAPRKRTENKGQFKNRLKAFAQKLFPGIPVTLKTADALLIAEFCRRKCEGLL